MPRMYDNFTTNHTASKLHVWSHSIKISQPWSQVKSPKTWLAECLWRPNGIHWRLSAIATDNSDQVPRIGVFGVVGGLRGIQTVNAVPSASDLTEIEPP